MAPVAEQALQGEMRRPWGMTTWWSQTRGWLCVRDPITGEIHELHWKSVPRSWLPKRERR